MPQPAPGGPRRAPWTERRWTRLIRGGRGRPLGLVLLAVLVLLVLLPDVPGLRVMRLASFDAYQNLFPRVQRSEAVTIVAIDEESLSRYGQWPWPRTLLARLVSKVSEARPPAIGLDLLMPEPDRLSPARLAEIVEGLGPAFVQMLQSLPGNDEVLAQTLRGRHVVLGLAGLEAGAPVTPADLGSPPLHTFGGDPGPFLRHFSTALKTVGAIQTAADGRGLISFDPERGVVRRMPLVATIGEVVVPALGLEMIRVATKAPALTVQVGGDGVRAVALGSVVVPTEPDGRVWIHFSRHDPSRFVSAADVLAGRVDPSALGRFVLIGVTALGLSDFHATPVADRQSSVEIHAQFLESVIDGAFLSRPAFARWIEGGALALGGLLLVLSVPRLRARHSMSLLLLLVGTLVALGVLLYLVRSILVDVITPALALVLLFTVMLGLTLAETQSQRRALRRQVEQQREAAARVAGELEAARRIQLGTLPRPAAAFPGERRFELYAFLEPAREVGGDLYDFFPLDEDHVFFMVGDVSGKGLPGSLFMAISKALCKSTALRRHRPLAEMMREADAEISRDNVEGLFVTVLAAILDARTGAVRFKLSRRDGRVVNATPEFDDCAKLAATHNLSVKDVQRIAIQAYTP